MKPDGGPRRRNDDLHDIIVFRKAGGAGERFPIDRVTGRHGNAQHFPVQRTGGRKARGLARPNAGNAAGDTGPALAISPTRPEPAAQNGTCIIINQENVKVRNTWSTARLNNEPPDPNDPLSKDPFDQPLEPLPEVHELLVAWPDGEIHLIRKQTGHGNAPLVSSIDMSLEGEAWYQLRNGLVAGRTPIVSSGPPNRIVPIVNVASLEDDEPDPPASARESANIKGQQLAD